MRIALVNYLIKSEKASFIQDNTTLKKTLLLVFTLFKALNIIVSSKFNFETNVLLQQFLKMNIL